MEVYREARKPKGSIDNLFETLLFIADGPMRIVEAHIHEYFEILYCLEGTFELTINGVAYPLREGGLAVVDPMEPHLTRSTGTDLNRYLVVKFVPEALYNAEQPIYEMKYIFPYLRIASHHRKVFDREELPDSIGALILEIHREFAAQAYGYELAVRSDLGRLFLWIIRRWHERCQNEEMDYATLEKMRHAYFYIEQNYAQDISLRDVAAEVGMSYSAFSRFFSRYAQKSFSQYLSEFRIKKSMVLLATTDQSVTEIALETGFSTTSYFIQQFHRLNDQTPGKYRIQFWAAEGNEPSGAAAGRASL